MLGGVCIALLLPLSHATEAGKLSSATLAEIETEYGAYALLRIQHWQYLIRNSRTLPPEAKLGLVNEFFNDIRFVSDHELWGMEDYWATPIETLAANGGDCEDFAIAKYFTLRELGIPAENMRLTYVKALQLNQAHMVLSYYPSPDAEPLILDNLTPEIQPAASRTDLLPVYSFNADGLWLARKNGSNEHLGKPSRLSQWTGVIARINLETTSSGPQLIASRR